MEKVKEFNHNLIFCLCDFITMQISKPNAILSIMVDVKMVPNFKLTNYLHLILDLGFGKMTVGYSDC